MLFDQVTREHIIKAVQVYIQKGNPEGLKDSSFYDVLIKGKNYPPKPIMAYANLLATNKKPSNYFEGGYKKPAFNRFDYLGIPIVKKESKGDSPLKFWIEGYKSLLKEPGKQQYNERYKWAAFEHFKNNWPNLINEENVLDALKNSFSPIGANLWTGSHYLPLNMLKEFAKDKPAELAKILNELFDETQDLSQRLGQFEDASESLLNMLRPGEEINHYQSARAMASYLAMRFPEKHYLYKASMYDDFCKKTKYTDYPTSRNGVRFKKILSFYEVAESIKPHLLADPELMQLHKTTKTDQISFNDSNLLTQDFIYGVANYLNINTLSKSYYWVNQGTNYKKEKDLGIISAPDDSLYHHKNLKDLKVGDVIIHYSNKAIRAISSVTALYATGATPHGKSDTNWLQVSVNYRELDGPKTLSFIQSSFKEKTNLLPKRHGPLAVDLSVKQAYLLNFNEASFELLFNSASSDKVLNEASAQNLILYGPPGTGKTYRLKNEFFPKYVVKETSLSSEEYFVEVVQDLSWFQVIALALIEEGKSKVQTIIENRWVKAKDALSASKNVRATIWGSLQTHTARECEFVKYKSRTEPLIFNKDQNSYWELLEDSLEEQVPELIKTKAQVDDFQANPNQEVKRYVFTTFHQAFSYEDFIEGIKPIMDQDEGGELSYQIEDGVFKRICKRALNDPQNHYAIFIDEINRGNIANIFGELITLIELDKRKGMPNEMSVTLPYSKQPFVVPSNLDIIGTMNTADRSVEALDTALRRRFNFKEMLPNTRLIETVLGEEAVFEEVKMSEVLKVINLRIEKLIDRDHSIGHAYFLKLKDQADQKSALVEIFCDNIIPLLQEYFYNDYPKIGLVLGGGFIQQIEQEVSFADFEADDSDDYLERPLYHLVSKEELSKDNVLSAALKTLLAKKHA